MSLLISKATGNFTSATGTWGLVDTTSLSNSEAATTALTTSYQTSSTFTPGAITIDGIAVKLSVRTGTTGTISVALDQAGSTVSGTEVTIDTADLPVAATADLNGGWVFFKFASSVLLVAATAYGVKAKTSSSSQVSLFSTATTNWSRALRTTTEQAPAAGDDLIICGQYIDASTFTAVVVTMDQTASTDYGAAPTAATSLVQPGIAVSNGGTLRVGTTAATNYVLKVSNSIVVYSGGVWEEGTTGTPMPRDSSFELTIDCGANVDYGFTARNLSTYTRQGQSRTSGKLIDRCLLNTDEAANSTSLGVDTDTGWLDNDAIVVVSTSRTGSDTEKGALNGNAGASSLTVDGFAGSGGGLLVAHSGTSPTQAEVVLLTRNVRMHGASASLQAYVDIKATAVVDWDWAQTYWMGSATTNKRGVDVGTITGSCAMDFCSFHEFSVASSIGVNVSVGTANNFSLEDLVIYGVAGSGFVVLTTSGTAWNANNILGCGCTGSSTVLAFSDGGGTIGNLSAVGNASTGAGISINEAAVWGAMGTLTAHSNGAGGISFTTSMYGNIANLVAWRNSQQGISVSGVSGLIVEAALVFGNTTSNLSLSGGLMTFNDGVFGGDTTFSTTNGIVGNASRGGRVVFNSCSFGVASGIITTHTRDISPALGDVHELVFNNCVLGSGTEVLTPTTLMAADLIFSFQKHDQTSGNNRQQRRAGLLTTETTSGLYDVSPSARIAPSIATEKFELIIGSVNLNSGQVATPSVKVRESVSGDGTDYNGNRVRLIVKRNDAMGITDDTVLDTATSSSEGAFETLTGACSAASEDGVLEFAIDCDGTTGWVNVDTLTVAVA